MQQELRKYENCTASGAGVFPKTWLSYYRKVFKFNKLFWVTGVMQLCIQKMHLMSRV